MTLMKSDFQPAIDFVLANEGGFVNNLNDSGGATNFGLSLRFLRGIADEKLRRYGIFEAAEGLGVGVIESLTKAQAELIYVGEFWNEGLFEGIGCQRVCNYFFDMCVNLGIHQATLLLQRGIWAAGFDNTVLRDDGVFGVRTLGSMNDFGETLLPVLVAMRASFYRLLVEIRPKDREFLNGWLKRCYRG